MPEICVRIKWKNPMAWPFQIYPGTIRAALEFWFGPEENRVSAISVSEMRRKKSKSQPQCRAEKAEEDNKSLLYHATTAEADLEEVKAEFRRAKERFNTALKGDE